MGHHSGSCLHRGHGGQPSSASEEPRPQELPSEIERVALAVRSLLLEDFPEHPHLERQCKRAGVLIHTLLRRRGLQITLRRGSVGGSDLPVRAEAGHVWCRVVHPDSGKAMLLDVTLSQYEELLGQPVPEVIWGDYHEVQQRYGYVEDGMGSWFFDPRNYNMSRVEAVEERLQEE